jgi:DNA-binding transcriptional ArsR family regulator
MSLDDDGAAGRPPGLRQLTDARPMRALAHPVRIALMEQLTVGGPMTATQLGEEIGETPTTCSFHLRQLAKYGFVEEAGGGKGRARPWRMSQIGFSFANAHDDPETEIAAGALSRLVRERQFERLRTWLETRTSYPRRWREAANDSEFLFYLTVDELEQFGAELLQMFQSRFPERLTDPSRRPPGALPVEMLMFSFPVAPPPAAGDDPGGEAA